MNNPFQIFNHPAFGDVRVAVRNGEPWFVANDACRALGYTRPDMAIKRHVLPEHKTYALVPLHRNSNYVGVEGSPRNSKAVGARRKMVILNESGLYSLVLAANTPEALDFKRWVVEEVIPTIRKTGSYSTSEPPPVEAIEPPALPEPVTLSAEDKRLLVDLCAVAPDSIKEQLVRTAANLIVGKDLF